MQALRCRRSASAGRVRPQRVRAIASTACTARHSAVIPRVAASHSVRRAQLQLSETIPHELLSNRGCCTHYEYANRETWSNGFSKEYEFKEKESFWTASCIVLLAHNLFSLKLDTHQQHYKKYMYTCYNCLMHFSCTLNISNQVLHYNEVLTYRFTRFQSIRILLSIIPVFHSKVLVSFKNTLD